MIFYFYSTVMGAVLADFDKIVPFLLALAGYTLNVPIAGK
jgi:hypothetical protein